MAAPPPPAAAAAAGAAGASPADKGRLTLRRELGRGAFGTVHYATTTDGGERAIKRIRVSSLTSNRHRLNLDREISLMREINHVNIVRLFGGAEKKTRLWGRTWRGSSSRSRSHLEPSLRSAVVAVFAKTESPSAIFQNSLSTTLAPQSLIASAN